MQFLKLKVSRKILSDNSTEMGEIKKSKIGGSYNWKPFEIRVSPVEL